MHLYINLFGLSIPSYGFMIATGVIIANLIAVFVLKKTGLDFNDFIIIEAYCMLGGFVGAKLLYFIVSYQTIEWSRILELQYFNEVMKSGFVFYGGLIGGLLMAFAAGRIHKIDSKRYIRTFIFLIPMIHSFGRIGCFMAGCCYGKPYDGIGAVVFPENSFALAGISLFPVQIVEAGILMIIAIIILVLQFRKNWYFTIETYLILYGIARFCLEYLRYDEIRGTAAGLSTSQWISILIIGISLVVCIVKLRCHRKELPE